MNKQQFLKNILIAILVSAFLFTACSENRTPAVAEGKVQTYTCPMHPQIVKDEPGTCPICGMDLVPFEKNNAEDFLTLGASQRALANITTMVAGTNEFSSFTRLNGRLTTDPEKTVYVSSRVAGRIETLFIKETGVQVKKGQPLYRIYSEQLSALQQEYLLATEQAAGFPDDRRFQQIETAAKQKLLLYGQTETQLQDLRKSKEVSPYVTYFAPYAGIVAEFSVSEGQYVEEGSTIMKLEDFNNLWVEAEIYPSELSHVKQGQQVQVIVAGYEDQPQTMTINFINPVLQPGTQTVQVRGTIANPGHQWQSGLQAIVLLPSIGKLKALTLPVDAVLREGKSTHVWIEKGENIFEPRMVTTGRENFDEVEITSGLNEGEKVVVSGAYLLYSEYILKKGKKPMAGMKM